MTDVHYLDVKNDGIALGKICLFFFASTIYSFYFVHTRVFMK